MQDEVIEELQDEEDRSEKDAKPAVAVTRGGELAPPQPADSQLVVFRRQTKEKASTMNLSFLSNRKSVRPQRPTLKPKEEPIRLLFKALGKCELRLMQSFDDLTTTDRSSPKKLESLHVRRKTLSSVPKSTQGSPDPRIVFTKQRRVTPSARGRWEPRRARVDTAQRLTLSDMAKC